MMLVIFRQQRHFGPRLLGCCPAALSLGLLFYLPVLSLLLLLLLLLAKEVMNKCEGLNLAASKITVLAALRRFGIWICFKITSLNVRT